MLTVNNTNSVNFQATITVKQYERGIANRKVFATPTDGVLDKTIKSTLEKVYPDHFAGSREIEKSQSNMILNLLNQITGYNFKTGSDKQVLSKTNDSSYNFGDLVPEKTNGVFVEFRKIK